MPFVKGALRIALAIAVGLGALLASPSPPARAESPSPARRLLKRWALTAVALAIAGGAAGFLIVLSGIIPIKASSGHWPITAWFLDFAKRRSVATHGLIVGVPSLDEPGQVLKGARHYEFGCRPCHGAPGVQMPRIPAHMTPYPPDLRPIVPTYEPEQLFYLVKHGIKFSGMPAWPAQGRDDEVWAMVSFLRRLPQLDARGYADLAGEQAAVEGAAPMTGLLAAMPMPAPVKESCSRCHGIYGLGRAGAFPKLAGQRREYLYASMEAFARSERHSGIMGPIASALDSAQLRQIASYYAALNGQASGADGDPTSPDIERGREIAGRGLPNRIVPPCSKCHGPGEGRRNPAYPRLAGQHADYIALQLSLFKEGRRGGTRYWNIMRRVARQLSEEDMRAVASYYAALPAEE